MRRRLRPRLPTMISRFEVIKVLKDGGSFIDMTVALDEKAFQFD
jgi:hypothetical protein